MNICVIIIAICKSNNRQTNVVFEKCLFCAQNVDNNSTSGL